jgi:hypothetical protein
LFGVVVADEEIDVFNIKTIRIHRIPLLKILRGEIALVTSPSTSTSPQPSTSHPLYPNSYPSIPLTDLEAAGALVLKLGSGKT